MVVRGLVLVLFTSGAAVEGIVCVLLGCGWLPGAASEAQPCVISVTIHAGPRALVTGRGRSCMPLESAAIQIYTICGA